MVNLGVVTGSLPTKDFLAFHKLRRLEIFGDGDMRVAIVEYEFGMAISPFKD